VDRARALRRVGLLAPTAIIAAVPVAALVITEWTWALVVAVDVSQERLDALKDFGVRLALRADQLDIKALRGALRILDHRVVWAPQVPEPALSGRLRFLGPQPEDLLLGRERLCRQERIRGPRQLRHVGGHVDELAVVAVPHLSDLQAHRAKLLVVLLRVRRVPAEVPHRALGRCQL